MGTEEKKAVSSDASTVSSSSRLLRKEVLGPLLLTLVNIVSVLWVMPLDASNSITSEIRMGLFVSQVFLCVGWLLFGPTGFLKRTITSTVVLLAMSNMAWLRTGDVQAFGTYLGASFLTIVILSSFFNLALTPSLVPTSRYRFKTDSQHSLRFRVGDLLVITAMVAIGVVLIDRNMVLFMVAFGAFLLLGIPLMYSSMHLLRAPDLGIMSAGKIAAVVPASIAPLTAVTLFSQPMPRAVDLPVMAFVVVAAATFFVAIAALIIRWSGYRLQ